MGLWGFWRTIFLAGLVINLAQAQNQINLHQEFERLIKLEVALLTEMEIANASGFAMNPKTLQSFPQQSWEADVVQKLLMNRQYNPDQMMLSHLNQLKANTLVLLSVSSRPEAREQQLRRVNNAYLNMMSVTSFYLKVMSPGANPQLQQYLANIRELANRVNQAIGFLRGAQPAQRNPDINQGGGDPYPIFVPRENKDPQTGQNRPDYAEGEVIPPNQDALKR